MNRRLLLALYDRSGLGAYMPVDYRGHELEVAEHMEKFAELVVRECTNVLRQEWYQLNNSEYDQTDSRSVGLHVGMKSGVNKSMVLIHKHFGVEE